MNQSTNISSLIWSTADDILRGLFKPSEYGRIILPFVVMRRLDCVLEPKKDEIFNLFQEYKDKLSDPTPVISRQVKSSFFNTSRYDLSRIKSDPNNVLINFKNYIQGYSQNVIDIIDNFSIDPLVEKLHKNKRLYLLIDKFTEFDLHPSVIDNHQMGTVYEELLRKFSEMSNEESGDHFTPRDVVKLLVSVIFSNDSDLKKEGIIRSIYDPCCGTGGMLTIGKQWILDNVNSDIKLDLYGQELNDITYSICKSDFLILGENPENIRGPVSTLSDDKFIGQKFNYMITNPPFGVSWKSDKDFVTEESKDPSGRFSNGLPWIKDGQLLFLSHMVSKMDPNGSIIGLVTNGSPLTTGDGNRGESQFRKFLVENDLLDTILLLPDDLFYNTGILCYLWILTNKKDLKRKGKVRVINCLDKFTQRYKPIGDKRKDLTDKNISEILELYQTTEESENLKYFKNSDFLYQFVPIHKKKISKDGSPEKDSKGRFKKSKGDSEKVKIPINQNINNYISQLKDSHNLFYEEDEVIIGSEFHLTKYFYQIQRPKQISETKKMFEDSLEYLHSHNFSTTHNTKIDNELTYWYGSINQSWSLKRIDECFTVRTEKVSQDDYPPLSVTKSGIVPQLDHVAKSNDTDNRTLVRKGDFVINSRSDRRGSCGVSAYDGSVSNVNTVLILDTSILNSKFVHEIFRTKEFQEEFYRHGKGIVDDLWTTSWSEMRNILIPVPSKEEQQEIVSKLDTLKKFKDLLNEVNEKFLPFDESMRSNLIFNN